MIIQDYCVFSLGVTLAMIIIRYCHFKHYQTLSKIMIFTQCLMILFRTKQYHHISPLSNIIRHISSLVTNESQLTMLNYYEPIITNNNYIITMIIT